MALCSQLGDEVFELLVRLDKGLAPSQGNILNVDWYSLDQFVAVLLKPLVTILLRVDSIRCIAWPSRTTKVASPKANECRLRSYARPLALNALVNFTDLHASSFFKSRVSAITVFVFVSSTRTVRARSP